MAPPVEVDVEVPEEEGAAEEEVEVEDAVAVVAAEVSRAHTETKLHTRVVKTLKRREIVAGLLRAHSCTVHKSLKSWS